MIAIPPNRPQQVDTIDPDSPAGLAFIMSGRDHLSFSQVSMFQACPLKWKFTYFDGLQPELVSSALLVGSGVHAAIEHHLQAVMTLDRPPTIEQLMEHYAENWARNAGDIPIRFGRGETGNSLAETACGILRAFLESPYAWPQGEILGIEETLRVPLAEDLPDLVARVDLLEHSNGRLTITDFKTARSMWSQATAEENADQLILYGTAAQSIAKELQAKVELQFVVASKTQTPRIERLAVVMDQDRIDRTALIVRRVWNAMLECQIYPSPSKMNCACCGYPEHCHRWHREASR